MFTRVAFSARRSKEVVKDAGQLREMVECASVVCGLRVLDYKKLMPS